MARGRAAVSSQTSSQVNTVANPYRTLTILGQDPNLRSVDGRLLTARVQIPNEEVSGGPRGYRVQVVDYDASASRTLQAARSGENGHGRGSARSVRARQHRQHQRRQHQERRETIQCAPARRSAFPRAKRLRHRDADAAALRARPRPPRLLELRRPSAEGRAARVRRGQRVLLESDEALLFGYFAAPQGGHDLQLPLARHHRPRNRPHALLDGLRPRYMEPSSPDQAAFHEGFADVVALLSVFSIREVVSSCRARRTCHARRDANRGPAAAAAARRPHINALRTGILLGFGEQFGEALSGVRGASLRRSVTITPSKTHSPSLNSVRPIVAARSSSQPCCRRSCRPTSPPLDPRARYRRSLPAVGHRRRIGNRRSHVDDGDSRARLSAADRYRVRRLRQRAGHLRSGDSSRRQPLSIARAPAQFVRAIWHHAFGPGPAGGEPGRWDPPLDPAASGPGPRTLDYSFVHREALERDREEVVSLPLAESARPRPVR